MKANKVFLTLFAIPILSTPILFLTQRAFAGFVAILGIALPILVAIMVFIDQSFRQPELYRVNTDDFFGLLLIILSVCGTITVLGFMASPWLMLFFGWPVYLLGVGLPIVVGILVGIDLLIGASIDKIKVYRHRR